MSTYGQRIKLIAIVLVVMLISAVACRKTDEENTSNDEFVSLNVPPGFPAPILSKENPLTRSGIALGRQLYYDTMLSSGGPRRGMSCSSCHLQDKGFTLPDVPVLPHVNLAWNKNFLWNGAVSGTLEDIMMFEVNDFFEADMQKLSGSTELRTMYAKAFGDETITAQRTAYALAQFMRTMISGNSLYDKYLRGETVLPADAQRGFEIFFSEKGDCFHCHTNVLLSDNDFHNTGLHMKSSGDMGRYLITGSASDLGKFKTPGLRNTALRNVYMHDGRFKSLREVIMHYNTGIQKSEYLDPVIAANDINLNEAEINDLIAFLNTLTDQQFLTDPTLSKP